MPDVIIEFYEYEREDLMAAVRAHHGTAEEQGIGGPKENPPGSEGIKSMKVSAPTEDDLTEIKTSFQISQDANTAG